MCQERGSRRGYLEDVEGSWSETWRTWSFLMSWMMFFFTLRKIPWTFCSDVLIRIVPGVFRVHWGFLTGDMEDMVLPDIMNDFFSLKKIPWKFHVDILIEVSVQDPQCLQITPILDYHSGHTSNIKDINNKTYRVSFVGSNIVIYDIRYDPLL